MLFPDKFTDADIIGNAILMFTAGSETVSSMLSFCLYELALNIEIQDKLRSEICSMKAKHDGRLNNDYLMDLCYTNMVLEGTTKFMSYIIYRVNHQSCSSLFFLPLIVGNRYIKLTFFILSLLCYIKCVHC